MSIRFLFYSLLALFLQACSETEYNMDALEKIDISKGFHEDKKSNLSDVAAEVLNIALETRPECIIGKIGKVVYKEGKLFVLDEQTQKLYIFDNNGSYLNRIDQIGRGPSEYLQITDFAVSTKNNQIVIYDDKQQKVLKYEIGGRFIDAHSINYWPLKIAFTPDQKQLALMSPRPTDLYSGSYSLSLLDKEWKPTARLIKHQIDDEEAYKRKALCFHNFFEYKDSMTIWESFCDTVYRVTKDHQILPRYLINVGEEKMPDEYAEDFEKFNQHVFEYAVIDKLLESGDYFFISGMYKGVLKEIFYNKKTKECYNSLFHYTYRDHGFHNDVDGGAPFWPYNIAGDDWVYNAFQAHEVKEYWELDYFKAIKVLYPEKKQKLKELIDKAKVDDNPIIQLVKLK